jgi:hypothetical protein
MAMAAVTPPDPSRGHGGAAVTDHDRDPLRGGYLTFIIEALLKPVFCRVPVGEKLAG